MTSLDGPEPALFLAATEQVQAVLGENLVTVTGSSAGWGKDWGREGVEGEQDIV